jgi:hypothetical protein
MANSHTSDDGTSHATTSPSGDDHEHDGEVGSTPQGPATPQGAVTPQGSSTVTAAPSTPHSSDDGGSHDD